MDSRRKDTQSYSNQPHKKIKTNKDVYLPSLISIPQGYGGPKLIQQNQFNRPGQIESVQRLVNRNQSADIPMPQFIQQQKQSQVIQPTSARRDIIPIPQTKSVPQRQSQLDLNAKLHKINLPTQYKDVLGDDLEELKQYAKRKEKKEKAILELIKSGKIQKVKLPKDESQKSIPVPDKIILTEDGTLRDKSGGVVKQLESQTSLKINQQKRKEEKIKQVIRRQKMLKEAINDRGKFFDRHLSASLLSGTNKRQKQKILALNFIEKGSISANIEIRENQNEQEVSKMEIEEKDEVIESMNKKVKKILLFILQGLAQSFSPLVCNSQSYQQNFRYQTSSAGFKRVAVKMKHYDPIPNIEWWDQEILPNQWGNYIPIRLSNEQEQQIIKQPATAHTQDEITQNINFLEQYDYLQSDLRQEKITIYVEHPEPFKISDIVQNRERAVLPTYLTKDEKKRLVRRKRMEVEKDKQNKIQLGLQEPDAPRITLNNMLRILGEEAIADPSKAEKQVRRQIQERYENHVKKNEQRKLNKEQKAEKIKKKWEKDAAQEVRMAVFRIEDLTDTQLRFKVTVNAQQVGLQGVCLSCKHLNVPSLVVVEGGPKGIKFYKKLLLNRIKWDLIKGDKPNECALIWEGVQKQHAFNRWRVIDMKSEAEGRLVLAERGLEHFWDLAMKHI